MGRHTLDERYEKMNNMISQIRRLPVAISTLRGWFAFDVIKTVNMTKLTNVNVHALFHLSNEISDELKACCDSQISWLNIFWLRRSLCTTEKVCHVVKSFHRVHFANIYFWQNIYLLQATVWPLYFCNIFVSPDAEISATLLKCITVEEMLIMSL